MIEVSAGNFYCAENLLSSITEVIHFSRFLSYRGDMDQETVAQELLKAAKHNETLFENIKELDARQMMDGQVMIQVAWEALPCENYKTWELANNLIEDVLDLID